MSIIYKNFRNILIVLLIAAVVLMRVFQPKPVDLKDYIKIGGKKYELLSKKVDTTYVDTTIYVTKYVPKYIPGKTKYIPVPTDVDTLAILKDYYTQYSYKDTVKVNTYGNGIISDEVTQNKIVNRSIIWDLKIPIVKETITVKELPKNQIYIGGGVGLDKVNLFNQVSAGFLLKTKSDKIYGLSVGISNTNINSLQPEITPFVQGSLYWKIRLGKK